MAQMMLKIVLLIVSSHVFVVGAASVSQGNKDCSSEASCESSSETFDEVSLLSLRAQISRHDTSDKEGEAVLTDSAQELTAEDQDVADADDELLSDNKDVVSTDYDEEFSSEGEDGDVFADEMSRTSCKTAKCHVGACGKGVKNAAKPKAIKLVDSFFCVAKFKTPKCCQEEYSDGTYWLRLAKGQGSVKTDTQACGSCSPLSDVAPRPMRLYVMRHAEGCHNLAGGGLGGTSNTHKGLGVLDAPLTDAGVQQAKGATPTLKKMKKTDIDRILVSPMRRAQMTVAIAIAGTPFDGMDIKVTPYVNEAGGGMMEGPENKPTSPPFQECLFAGDALMKPFAKTTGDIVRCVQYGNPQDKAQSVATCNPAGTAYTDHAKLVAPQQFMDFILAMYGPKGVKSILMAGHSNWAKKAGIYSGTKDSKVDPLQKVNWASIWSVILTPGHDVQADCLATKTVVYAGTPRNAGTEGASTANARCVADVQLVNGCKAKKIPYKGF